MTLTTEPTTVQELASFEQPAQLLDDLASADEVYRQARTNYEAVKIFRLAAVARTLRSHSFAEVARVLGISRSGVQTLMRQFETSQGRSDVSTPTKPENGS